MALSHPVLKLKKKKSIEVNKIFIKLTEVQDS